MIRQKYFFPYILFAINALLLTGCDIVNPPEDIPAYIYIKDYTFTTNEVKEGTASNKISDAWLYVGNSFLGAFELPATIPSLEKGSKNAIIMAGIKENGISTTRVPYPFYKSFTIDLALAEMQTDTIKPVWTYKDETLFPLLENFEGSTLSLELSPRSTTGFGITTNKDSAFEGNSALFATLDPGHIFFECETKNAYVLPRGKPVWLEINYKTEVPVEVGVLSIGSSGNARIFSGGMNPSPEWNKIYINLTTTVSVESPTQVFKIYLSAFNKDAGGKILIDNLKLLYLE